MKKDALILGLAMMLAAGGTCAAAAPPGTAATERTAVGADVGATAAGAFAGAVSLAFSVELPLSRAWAIDLEPSVYVAPGTGVSILQVNAGALARFYFMSLFVADAARPAQWGPFFAAGAVAAWEYAPDQAITVLALGPAIRAGYRVVFGDAGFSFEPSVGFMALFGGHFEPAGTSASANAGLTLGLIAGWRF